MDKTIGIVILAALLLCGNASFIEHIYNSTHLKGDVKLDTDNGIKVGYGGSLSFDNGIIGFEIANVGGSFKAVVKPGDKVGNATNTSVDYSGEVTVSRGCHSANITVNGTTGLAAEWDGEKTETGGKLAYNATITNNNQWTVAAGNHTVQGTTEGGLNATGRVERDGNTIWVKKRLRGGVEHKGQVNGTAEDGGFTVAKWGELKLAKEIRIQNTTETNGTLWAGALPSVAYGGVAKVKRGEYVAWGNDTVLTKAKGKGKFGGLLWYERRGDNETQGHSIKHAKHADFVHGGKVTVNGKTHVIYGGAGIVGGIGSAELRTTQDGNFTGAFFDAGNLNHVGVAFVKPTAEDAREMKQLIENMGKNPAVAMAGAVNLDEDQILEADRHRHRKIKTYTQAGWGAGKGIKVVHNGDNTVDVDTHGGAVWEVNGWASNSKKPFHDKGEQHYSTSFEIDRNTATVRNILMKFGNNPKAMEQLKQRYEEYKLVAAQ